NFDCNGDSGTPHKPCQFTKGSTYHGELSVTPNSVINNGTVILFHAIIGGIPLPFDIPDKEMCKGHNVTCPLTANVPVVVDVSLTVPAAAPALNFISKIELQASGEKDLLCAKFMTTIVSSEEFLTI
uniref:ML domain-containing protein n=1 Tax=Salmonella sp. s51933 TaxID=3160127 RepID=UPI003754A1A9